MLTFTEDEVRQIIGKPIDIQAKFEDIEFEANGDVGMHFSVEECDSDEVFGDKLAYYANTVSAIATNDLIDKQLERMKKIGGVS